MYYYYSYCCLCHYCITMTIIIISTVKSLLIQSLLNMALCQAVTLYKAVSFQSPEFVSP